MKHNELEHMRIARVLSATALAFALTTGVASAQVGTTTPGVPSTGVGGAADMTIVLTAGAALIAMLGATYLMRRRAED